MNKQNGQISTFINQTIERNKQPTFEFEFIDNSDLCMQLKISKRTAQTWRSSGMLPYVQISKKIYYKYSDIKKHMESNYQKSPKR